MIAAIRNYDDGHIVRASHLFYFHFYAQMSDSFNMMISLRFPYAQLYGVPRLKATHVRQQCQRDSHFDSRCLMSMSDDDIIYRWRPRAFRNIIL